MSGSWFERSVLTTTLLALAAYLVASGDVALGLLVLPLFLLGWVVSSRSGAGGGLPKPAVLAMTGAAVALVLLTMLADGISVEALSRFVAVLLVVKAFDRDGPRDDSQIIALSLFLVLGAMVTSVRLIPGMLAILFVPSLISSVLLYHIEVGRRAHGELTRTTLQAERGFGRDLAILGAGSGVLALIVAVGVFVMVPRGIGAASNQGISGPGVGSSTGFSAEVDLARGGTIQTDQSVVLEVRPLAEDASLNAVAPPIMYLRGAVLDEYRGGRWRSSSDGVGGASVRTIPEESWVALGARLQPTDETYQITIRNAPAGVSPLFLPENTVGLKLDVRGDVRWVGGRRIAQRSGGAGRVGYQIRVATPSPPEPAESRSMTEPFEDESVRALAVGLLEDAGLEPDVELRPIEADLEAARLFRTHLTRNHDYTLDRPEVPLGEDPVAWFLTNGAAGHCEYFASALVAMCRSVGINARVVAGYVAAEFNPATGAYTVRRSNAHAWAEVERSVGDWVLMDPTPSADLREIHQPETSTIRRARQFLEVIEQAWVNSVVAFDARRRSRLLGLENSNDPTGLRTIGESVDRISQVEWGQWRTAIGWGLLAASLTAGLGFGTLWAFRRSRLSRAPVFEWQRWPEKELEQAHAVILNAFEERSIPKPLGCPLLQHAEVSGQADLRVAAELLCRWRFGGRPDAESLRTAIQRISRPGS